MKNTYIVLIIYIFFLFYFCNYAYAKVDENILKSCFSNISEIKKAVEKYNKENEEKITDFHDYSTILFLIKRKYLKEIVKPASSCMYNSIGDLSDNGIIFCNIHGDIRHFVYCDTFSSENLPKISRVCPKELFKIELERIKKITELDEERREKDYIRLLAKKKELFVFTILGIIIGFTELLRIIYKYTISNKKSSLSNK